ncbi:SET domain-containing protein [Aaosphaeria arxii CBS 175.79]|uniref:SET domain-containing protein n=1 Tax=Aaosphaeria arxii CBS 175.79 TaxID=1450172 RepID=A0A6A5Y0A3_9PLEO|nr:SET domain-containing protein [Aaosphaeria arxii CBS 175.79]KAF2018882.1 SET domain-containing protein [Aaosphaeria arxii CBS 175.79]
MPSHVAIPISTPTRRRVLIDRVEAVLCHRSKDGEEQYLVRWKNNGDAEYPPLSWHSVSDLARCLEYVQDYIESRSISQSLLKRKSPDNETEYERRPSPFERQQSVTYQSTSVASVLPSPAPLPDIYNGVFDSQHTLIFARSSSGPSIARLSIQNVPTPEMLQAARTAITEKAAAAIRQEYTRRLKRLPGVPITLLNLHDASTPSLRFRYITEYILRDGVYKADPETQEGCQQCSTNMGRSIGCEYTKKCECLEYAAVDTSRLDDEQLELYKAVQASGGSTMGFPKKFPYFAEGTKIQRAGCLVRFYLDSRNPIYECNDSCMCGPYCRNKNVQFGRTVELEIFRTTQRGWGLRCKEDLHEGQFIDTYRGEIITDEEADRREAAATSKAKGSYLYSLDKFQESEGLADEDIYVVDGEFMGGPTKFMNHSCEPNCRQYTVSYNKHDCRVYDIALFACEFIPKGTELTFDYLDKEDDVEVPSSPSEGAILCLCGTEKCRRWLWT